MSLSLAGCLVGGPEVTPTSPPVISFSPPPKATATPTGWTSYIGVNDIQSLAFAPDGALWAATGSGVVRWDLLTEGYVHYTAEDGLGASYTTALAFAPDGTLWAATLGGVSHFDGTHWTTYTEADGLISNAAQSVAVTPEGIVWVGTTEGVSRFDGNAWTTYLPNVRAWEVALAPDGSVWFANHGRGLSRYTPATDTWVTYPADGGVTAIAVGPDGTVWGYINYQGLYRFDGTDWQRAYQTGGRVCDIALAGDGTPWIATCGGTHTSTGALVYRQGEQWIDLIAEGGLVNAPVRAVAFGPEGLIAVGTKQGIGLYQRGEWRWLRGGPIHNRVIALAVDANGAAWFGFGDQATLGPGQGVSRFDGQAWEYSLAGTNVHALALAPDGTIWAGAGCTVRRFDGQSWQTLADCQVLNGNVNDIAFTPDGAAWLAGGGLGLAYFDGRDWATYDKLAISLAVAPDGALWVTGWEGRQDSFYLAHFDGRDWTTYKTSDTVGGGVGPIAITPDGAVWGPSGDDGLARFDGQNWAHYSAADGFPTGHLNTLAVAPDGTLWAGTNHGAARLDGESWTVYTSADGLADDVVQAIAFAPDGVIWFGTANGVSRFHPN